MSENGYQEPTRTDGACDEEAPGPLTLTVLVNNTTRDDKLMAELGFSLLIETASERILFDTGQGAALEPNARRLGIDLSGLDALVLSHGHYDHTGGIPDVLRQNPGLKIYAHPDLFNPRYSQLKSPPHKPIGIPLASSEALGSHLSDLTWTAGPTRIAPGVWVTGAIPRVNPFEDTGGVFFLDPEGQRTDPIEGDQALWIRTAQGIVAIVGCAHAGVVNTLDAIARLAGAAEFRAVIGGMHLLNAGPERLARTMEAFKRHHIRKLGACHCTGKQAQELMKETFAADDLELKAGMRLTFSNPGSGCGLL